MLLHGPDANEVDFLKLPEKMMKGLMIAGALLAVLFSNPSHAWDCNYWSQSSNPKAECYKAPPPPVAPTSTVSNHNTNSNSNSNSNRNYNRQQQQQTQQQLAEAKAISSSTSYAQGGAGGAGGSSDQHQHQEQSADNAGNQQISNYDAARIPVNTAIAGIGMTTAGCRFAEGLGVQTNPAGASVGFSFKDKDCARFQLAQYMYSRGQVQAADIVMCKITLVYDALGTDCLLIVGSVFVAPVAQLPPPSVEYPPGEREKRQTAHGYPNLQK